MSNLSLAWHASSCSSFPLNTFHLHKTSLYQAVKNLEKILTSALADVSKGSISSLILRRLIDLIGASLMSETSQSVVLKVPNPSRSL